MTDDQRAQELAAITPADVTQFISNLAYWRSGELMPTWVTYHSYPTAEARCLGMAKRFLDTVLAWRPDADGADDTKRLIALLVRTMKEAVITADRVQFRFTGSELLDLRSAVGLLENYDLTRQRDARDGDRPYRRKK